MSQRAKAGISEHPFNFDLAVATEPTAFSGGITLNASGRIAEIDATLLCDGLPSADGHIYATKFREGKGTISVNVDALVPSASPKSKYTVEGTLFVDAASVATCGRRLERASPRMSLRSSGL